jgi:hypothetical protein
MPCSYGLRRIVTRISAGRAKLLVGADGQSSSAGAVEGQGALPR